MSHGFAQIINFLKRIKEGWKVKVKPRSEAFSFRYDDIGVRMV
jgi:hypothetical protein